MTYKYTTQTQYFIPEFEVDFENIIPWNGQNDTGRDVRLKWERNFGHIANNFKTLEEELRKLLRKDRNDKTEYLLEILGGVIAPFIESFDFVTGPMGAGFTLKRNKDGSSYCEVDKLQVRRKAVFQMLSIMETELSGASFMFNASGARATITKVERIDAVPFYYADGSAKYYSDGSKAYVQPSSQGAVYRCYFLTDDGETAIENRFKPGNLVRSQTFNIKEGTYEGVSNHYWWRLVTAVGENWIDVSVNHCDEGSDIPKVGDAVVQLGDIADPDYQSAIVLSAYGDGAPYINMYQGIDGYSLSNKDSFSVGYDRVKKECYVKIHGRIYIGDREGGDYISYSKSEGLKGKFRELYLSAGDSVINIGDKITFAVTEEEMKAAIIQSVDSIAISVKNDFQKAGLKVTSSEVLINADKFKITDGNGANAGLVFEWKNGKPMLRTSCVDVDSLKVKHLDGADGTFSGTISANGAKIGGFTIDNGSLNWKGRDYFGNDSRSIRLGVPTDANSGMIDINFNGATDGKFGVKVIGSNAGGACIYASRNGTSKPHIANNYAGYFDGGVHVNGALYTNTILSNEFGTGWSLQADGSYTYKKGVTRTISWTIQNGSIPSIYSLVFENGILVD